VGRETGSGEDTQGDSETAGAGDTETQESSDSQGLGSSFALGDFLLEVESSKKSAPWIRVTHSSSPDKVLFESAPGLGFVGAGAGDPLIEENRGSFLIEEKLERRCMDQTLETIAYETGELRLEGSLGGQEGCEARWSMLLSSPSSKHLRFALTVEGQGGENRAYIRFASRAWEKFFGFGESFTYLDLKGKRFPVLTQEQGIGRGKQPLSNLLDLVSKGSAGSWYTTYAAAPYTLTSDLRGFFLENSEVSFFDLTAPEFVEVSVLSSTMTGRVLAGDTALDIIEAYTEYAGRMPPLPDWLNEGAVVGTQGGTLKVVEEVMELERLGCPVGAVWLQDWVGKRQTNMGSQLWWNWELSELWYPGWHDLVGALAERGIRVLTYVNPFLVDMGPDIGLVSNLFREARSKGYLVLNSKGIPYLITNTDFDAGMLDLSNPAVWTWFKGVLRDNVFGVGASGYMADFAEALPFDAVLSSGEDAAAYHNRYPEQWAALHREFLEEEGLMGDAVFFSRAGFTRSPAYSTLFWQGDQLHSFDGDDGLASAITGLISSGLSGYSLNHSDIGGYTTIAQWYVKLLDPFQLWGLKTVRSMELFERWAEVNAFTAVYRTHEGLIPEENVQFYTDERSYRHFTRFAKVYKALAPYRRGLMEEAWLQGYPLVRHPWLHFQDDPEALELTGQFMLGPELMVAPVLEEGAVSVQVYLPKGRWVLLWTDEIFDASAAGTWFEVPAPIGQPAVLYPEGSFVGQELRGSLVEMGLI
jgi:alpha-glucosidase